MAAWELAAELLGALYEEKKKTGEIFCEWYSLLDR